MDGITGAETANSAPVAKPKLAWVGVDLSRCRPAIGMPTLRP